MSTLAETLHGVTVTEAESPFAKREYVPGGGGFVSHLTVVDLPAREFGELNMRHLASLHRTPDHPLHALVTQTCGKRMYLETPERYIPTGQLCAATYETPLLFAVHTSCDACRADYIRRGRMDALRDYWFSICRAAYRQTDTKHKDFPRAQAERLKEWKGETSLFFFGPPRVGKTRLAILLAKRAMLAGLRVGILYSDVLDRINPQSFNETPIETWGRYDLVVLDDALLTAKTQKLCSYLKHLIGYLMDNNRRFIITSQVSGDDYIEHIKKGGEASRVDTDTAEALMGRIRECCPAGTDQQVSFAQATTVKDDEQAF